MGKKACSCLHPYWNSVTLLAHLTAMFNCFVKIKVLMLYK